MPLTSNHNFMLADFAGVAIGFVLFSCLTVLPGYALGWILDVLRFRKRELWFRFAVSVPLAIALGPLLSYFGGKAGWVIFGALSVMGIALIFQVRRRFKKPSLVWVGVVWCSIAVLALCDLQIGRRLYFSIIGFDYAVRTAFVSSIATFGLPAQNPFFYPGAPVALRYHYYWLLQPALLHRAASPFVDARQALIAGTIWCGIGLLCLIVLYSRFFRIGASRLRRQTLIAFGLLLVTGLDIFPALFFLVLAKLHLVGNLPPSLEWWNDQVDGWLYSMLWEPHYVAGLIACLFGFLVISQASGRRWVSGTIAGLCFATGVGAAIYVAFVFAIFLLCWGAVVLWKRWYGELLALALAGVTAFVCSLPFLESLRGPGSGGAFLHLTVRSFFAVDVLSKMISLNVPLANLVCLPLNYFLELGFFFAAGVMEWRRLRQMDVIPRKDLALAVMLLVSVAVCTFLRSGVIANNDLGWRGFLIAQFVLLIRGSQLPLLRSRKMASLAVLGFAGTVYDQALLRFYPLLSDGGVLPKVAWLAADEKLGQRTYANREAYEWLRENSADISLIQQNPHTVVQDSFYGLYADRHTAAEDAECSTFFGGDPKACAPVQEILTPVYGAHASETSFESACTALPIDFIIAKDTDAAWGGEESWVWKCSPIFANSFVRVFRCAPSANRPSR